MGVLTEIYVDPAGNANSGAGTIGSPYLDLQYALNTATRDATNGNRFNIKAGTAEVITAALSFATFGSATSTAQTVFQGYTSAAGDGGIGDLTASGSSIRIYNAASAYVHWRDLKIHNTGGEITLLLGAQNSVINCEVYSNSYYCIYDGGGSASILGNNIHDTAGAIYLGSGNALVYGNYAINAATAIVVASDNNRILRNILTISGGSEGINCSSGAQHQIMHNSILSSGGTGNGIRCGSAYAAQLIANNLIGGFSGAGGGGIKCDAGDIKALLHNAVYNCTTAYNIGDIAVLANDNETIGADPFAKSGSNTFANRFTYFAPVDTGNVWGKAASGAYLVGSYLDKGAVQHIAAAGGGGGGRPEFRGSNL